MGKKLHMPVLSGFISSLPQLAWEKGYVVVVVVVQAIHSCNCTKNKFNQNHFIQIYGDPFVTGHASAMLVFM